MIPLSITILIYISSLEFLWVPIMIFSLGYQPIYCAFPPYCALLCHNYSRLFYYTFNISSLLFRLIFYPSVNLRSVRLNIGSDEFWSFRLIFGMSCDCCAIRSKPGLTPWKNLCMQDSIFFILKSIIFSKKVVMIKC